MFNLSTSMKFEKTRRDSYTPTLQSLPTDLLIDILTRVASTSFTDFFNAKLRDFLEVSENKFIMKKISVEKFNAVPWWKVKDELSSFLETCKESENPELLYRQGMMEFFNLKKVESGEEYLKRAMEMEHMEASYVYGIILLSKGGASNKEQGIKLLNEVKKSRKLGECRERTRALIHSMWVNNPIVKSQELTSCHAETCGERRRRRGWPWINERDELEKDVKDGNFCEACMWEYEVSLFCKQFR